MVQASVGGTRTAQRNDPLATFKFWVEVEGIVGAEFTECSGLEMATDVFEYQEGGCNQYSHKLPGRTKLSNVTLKRGFATNIATDNTLYEWYKEMEESMMSGKKVTRKKVTIMLYSSADPDVKMTWTLDQAIPVKWVSPAFKVGEAAIAIETLEFAHHGIILH